MIVPATLISTSYTDSRGSAVDKKGNDRNSQGFTDGFEIGNVEVNITILDLAQIRVRETDLLS